MSDERQKSGTRRSPRLMAGRAMAVVVSSVVLLALGATPALARPAPVNPPAPTGTVTTNSNGTVTVNLTGSWSWPVGTGPAQIHATAGSPASECAGFFGVGWGVVWNDPKDHGYTITYRRAGHKFSTRVGSTGDASINTTADESVHYDTAAPCGTFSASAVTGQWTASHTYASASTVPSGGGRTGVICVVNYILRAAIQGHRRQYLVDTNRNNSFRTAVKTDNYSTWPASPACFDPSTLKASPTIVTTATNAQVGSAITDTSTLSGTTQDVTASTNQNKGKGTNAISVVSNAGGTVVFDLYGPSDTNCTSTPIFTSSAMAVNGDGTYGPVSFTPTQGAGTYRWIATYSGDTNNNGATELCGATGETSAVTAAPVTTVSNPPTSPSSSVPVVVAAAAGSTPVPVAGATTVHTGEPWAGSQPFVIALAAFGLALMGLGFFERRRAAVRRHSENSALSAD